MGKFKQFTSIMKQLLAVMGVQDALSRPVMFETRNDKVFLLVMVVVFILNCLAAAGLAVFGIVKLFKGW